MSDSLTVRSMADALTEDKHKNGSKGKIYKALSDEHKNEEISLSIKNKATALKKAINAPKVNLADTEQVKERAFMYLEACGLASCFPSVMGLSVAMGCSRQNLNQWLLAHPGHPTIALCYGFQMLPHLETEDHDLPVDTVIWSDII